MKKLHLLLILAAAFLAAGFTSAQTLYFCEGVDDDGYPINSSTSFTIPDEGGYLYFLTRLDYEVNCYEVLYDIYKVNSRGEETFENTIYQDVEENWVWFWKQINFYESGTYKVYVYDEDWSLITSGKLKVSFN